MSLKALNWAFEQEMFSSPQKFVLVALANFASETGKSYPSAKTICKITMQDEKTVRKSLTVLAKAGRIKDTGQKYGPTQQVKVWQLPPEACQIKATQNWVASEPEDTQDAGTKVSTKVSKFGERTIEPGTEEPKQLSEHYKLTRAWPTEFETVYGRKYKVTGFDVKALQRFFDENAEVTAEQFMAVARRAWAEIKDDEWKQERLVILGDFCTYWPKITGAWLKREPFSRSQRATLEMKISNLHDEYNAPDRKRPGPVVLNEIAQLEKQKRNT